MDELDRASLEKRQPAAAGLRLARSFVIALIAFLTVVDLFAAQALLPSLVAHYGVSPAAMGLAVNACTLGMAVAGLGVALLGNRLDQRRGIIVSLVLLSVPTALLAWAPDLATFAALRVMQGVLMATAFSLTLGHLGERYSAEEAASAFAAYITGNVASNLIGRLISATVVGHSGLTAAFLVFAALNLAGAMLARVMVTRHAGPPSGDMRTADMMGAWTAHLADPALRPAFAIGFAILFAFIGTFTFVNFVLTRPPLSIGMMQLGLVYFVFLPSIVTTPFAGALGEAIGPGRALWATLGTAGLGLPLLLASELELVLTGLVLVAVGTFAAQALATGYVSRTAKGNRAAASGIYLASYFLGGLVGTALLGQLFDRLGWSAAVAGIAAALAAAAYLASDLDDPSHARQRRGPLSDAQSQPAQPQP